MKEIYKRFPITDNEYSKLKTLLDKLAHDVSWKLLGKNTRNNHTEEEEDIFQEVSISMLTAGTYYKRQVYIESCLELCKTYSIKEDVFIAKIVERLVWLWKNKTRHGANRQKFGPHQELILEKMTKMLVPSSKRPSKKAPLIIDSKFKTYCKSIMWNRGKAMGKRITREKGIRGGLVSLSEFDYLGV